MVARASHVQRRTFSSTVSARLTPEERCFNHPAMRHGSSSVGIHVLLLSLVLGCGAKSSHTSATGGANVEGGSATAAGTSGQAKGSSGGAANSDGGSDKMSAGATAEGGSTSANGGSNAHGGSGIPEGGFNAGGEPSTNGGSDIPQGGSSSGGKPSANGGYGGPQGGSSAGGDTDAEGGSAAGAGGHPECKPPIPEGAIFKVTVVAETSISSRCHIVDAAHISPFMVTAGAPLGDECSVVPAIAPPQQTDVTVLACVATDAGMLGVYCQIVYKAGCDGHMLFSFATSPGVQPDWSATVVDNVLFRIEDFSPNCFADRSNCLDEYVARLERLQ